MAIQTNQRLNNRDPEQGQASRARANRVIRNLEINPMVIFYNHQVEEIMITILLKPVIYLHQEMTEDLI